LPGQLVGAQVEAGSSNPSTTNFRSYFATQVEGVILVSFAGVAIQKVDECAPENFRRGNA